MTASSQTPPSPSRKKFWLLGAGVIVVIAVYSAAWFYIANEAKARLVAALDLLEPNGISVKCPDIDIRGYPFRIGLFCSGISVDDHRNGISGEFGALRSAAQIYDPSHFVWEIDAPAVVRTTAGLTLSAEWAKLQSSLRLNLTGLTESSTVTDGLKAVLVTNQTGNTINFDAAHTESHLRRNNADLDAAILIETATAALKDQPPLLPPLSTSLDVTFTGKAGVLDDSDDMHLQGTAGTLHRLIADAGEGRVITLSGPFSFDDEGFLSGQLKVDIENINAWRETLKQTLPDLAKTIDTAGNMLTALSGDAKVSVDLTVDRGKVLVSGFIPIGKIPPIR